MYISTYWYIWKSYETGSQVGKSACEVSRFEWFPSPLMHLKINCFLSNVTFYAGKCMRESLNYFTDWYKTMDIWDILICIALLYTATHLNTTAAYSQLNTVLMIQFRQMDIKFHGDTRLPYAHTQTHTSTMACTQYEQSSFDWMHCVCRWILLLIDEWPSLIRTLFQFSTHQNAIRQIPIANVHREHIVCK